MNLAHFHPKSIENFGKNNSSVNIRFVAKTSDLMLYNIRSGDIDSDSVASTCTSFLSGLLVSHGKK